MRTLTTACLWFCVQGALLACSPSGAAPQKDGGVEPRDGESRDGGSGSPEGGSGPSDSSGGMPDVSLRDAQADIAVDAIAIPPVERFCNEGGVLATLIQNGLCLLCPLPTSTGEQCSIFIAGLAGDCSGPGLSPATSQEIATLETEKGPLPSGSVCKLQELAMPPAPAKGCVDQEATGWCYETGGSCLTDGGAYCDAALCTTNAFAQHYIPEDANLLTWGTYLMCP
jgi:hypothetical protein